MESDNFTVQVGNLCDDPELRFTQVSREFAISEGCSAGNRSGGSR
jgi:single-stranded DNA-binding protein